MDRSYTVSMAVHKICGKKFHKIRRVTVIYTSGPSPAAYGKPRDSLGAFPGWSAMQYNPLLPSDFRMYAGHKVGSN